MEASVVDTSNNGVQQHDEHDDTNEETPIPTPLKEQQPFFVMDWLVDMVGDDQRSHRLARLIELQSRKFVLNRQRIDRDIVASVRKLEKQRRISHLIKIPALGRLGGAGLLGLGACASQSPLWQGAGAGWLAG